MAGHFESRPHRPGAVEGTHVTDLVLHESEQSAVRAVIGSEPVPGAMLPGARLLRDLARLIACDAVGIAVLDGAEGTVVGEGLQPQGLHDEQPPLGAGHIGIVQRARAPAGGSAPSAPGVAVLSLAVHSSSGHVIKLWMVRRTTDFTQHERALLRLVAPAVERLLRERPTSTLPPSLTEQERRVLYHLGTGLTNAEIAERLGVAPATVRKHLENAYRKLGVTNRLAAVTALGDGRRALSRREPR